MAGSDPLIRHPAGGGNKVETNSPQVIDKHPPQEFIVKFRGRLYQPR
jgi:hypothetical protein